MVLKRTSWLQLNVSISMIWMVSPQTVFTYPFHHAMLQVLLTAKPSQRTEYSKKFDHDTCWSLSSNKFIVLFQFNLHTPQKLKPPPGNCLSFHSWSQHTIFYFCKGDALMQLFHYKVEWSTLCWSIEGAIIHSSVFVLSWKASIPLK